MKEFARVLRDVARRRVALFLCLASSLFVALLWGMNISAVYPLVEVIFKGSGAASYISQQAAESERLFAEKTAEAERHLVEATSLSEKLATLDPASQQWTELNDLRKKLQWQQELAAAATTAYGESAKRLRWLEPHAQRYLPDTPYQTLVWVMVILIVGTIFKLVALTVNLMLVQELSQRAAMQVRERFFRKALKQDLEHYGDSGAAGLTTRLTSDVNDLALGISIVLGRLVREPLKMAVCLIGAGMICWRLLMVTFIIAPIVGLIIQSLSKGIRRSSRRVMEEMTQLYGMLTEAFAGIRVVRAYNTEAYERARFRRGALECYRKSMKVAFYNSASRFASESLGTVILCVGMMAGGYLVLNERTDLFGIQMRDTPISVPEMLLFFSLLIGASDPARKLSDVWSNLQRGIAASERLMEVIDTPIHVTDPAQPRVVARPHQTIRFNDVHFKYPTGPAVLRGLSLTIRHGESWAIVGPNGSGKSTLISLLCRFYDPYAGTIEMDGIPITEMRTRDLRSRIGLVTQRTVVFDDTILNNILYGSPGKTAEQAIEAARRAHADKFIRTQMPDGYETVLGSKGLRLSGGQMQRVALARAFLREPDILILDEATSQVDIESEQLIHEALADFLRNRTGIMITHRSSTLALAGQIAVLEGGQLSDSGSYAELAKQNSFFQSLINVPVARAA